MEEKLYLECYSGISGDMTVAALLDLGASQQVLEKALKSLPIKGFDIRISRVKKSALDACDFAVLLDEKHNNYDHDMEYLHGHAHHDHTRHEHNVSIHEHGQHPHEHRGIVEIIEIIQKADITEQAKKIAIHIFEVLAKAEAKAHGVSMEEVHFHEVGAVDSIVDIISVAVCVDNLGIRDVIVSELYEGRGFIRCQHGMIPIPVPAVVNIAIDSDIHLHITEDEGEFVTPTGAAIVAALKTGDCLPEKFVVERIGIGAGKRNYSRSGILRAMLIKTA